MLNEKALHASLKEWYTEAGDRLEVPFDGFVVDIVRGDLLLEIQTGNFASLKSKLGKLTQDHHVRLIHPIASEKWIVKQPTKKVEKTSRRKSPKKGRVEDLFHQLVSIPRLLLNPNFSLEILLIQEEEVRYHDAKRAWRKKGWVTEERRLLKVVDQRLFKDVADLVALLPDGLGDTFTTADIADGLGIQRRLAQEMTYCLSKIELLEPMGKQGRNKLYSLK